MPQSPELAGGEGFTYEGNVAAFYCAAMLAEAYAPGIGDRIVCRVSFQQRDFSQPLDDVIVDFKDISGNEARLSLQVKRALTISDAETNKDFHNIIRDSWATFKNNNFRLGIDRYGVAVGTISAAKDRTLKALCDLARASINADHFFARFAPAGNASKEMRAIKDIFFTLLNKVNSTPCTDEELFKFLAHFVLVQLDLLHEGNTDSPTAINHIKESLAPADANKAPLVWARIIQLVRESAGKAGQLDRMRLVKALSVLVRFRGAPSLQADLNRLTELAKSYAELIPDDIGKTKLERKALFEEYKAKLATARLIQVRGLPGSGKSVIIRRAVEEALTHGPVLFLKAEQLEGTSWVSYATAQGLSNVSLEQLLTEISATGSAVLFIDAIDRIEKKHQAIVLDLLRIIINSPRLNNWRVVVSLRDSGIEVLRNWLGEILIKLQVESLQIDALNDQEAEILAKEKPHLRPLLFGTNSVREIVRRPFFTKILNQGYVADPSSPMLEVRTELELIEYWWRQGGYNETGQNALERQQTLLKLAKIRANSFNQPILLSTLHSITHVSGLVFDGILQTVRDGLSVRFAHDIFFEWAFYHVLAERGPDWMHEVKACGEPPAVARTVELVSQWEYFKGNDWLKCLQSLEGMNLRSQWLRAWLLGPLTSAEFNATDEQFASAAFANDFDLFRKALVWFQAEKTVPSPQFVSVDLQIAYLLAWPSDFAAWRYFIKFTLKYISEIPKKLYPEILAVFEVWQNIFANYQNQLSHALLEQCTTWLLSIDYSTETVRLESKEWKDISDIDAFYESLMQLVLRASNSEPDFAANYLNKIKLLERIPEKIAQKIIAHSGILSQTLPELFVDFVLAILLDELPHDTAVRCEQERQASHALRQSVLAKPECERTELEKWELSLSTPLPIDFGLHDWDKLSLGGRLYHFFPPSPLKEPFHSLFLFAPKEALRLLRELCNHAIRAWQQLHHYDYERRATPLPLELTFTWGTQKFWGGAREYLWCRGVWEPHVLDCGFMALEEWCFAELERNTPADELIQTIIKGNECIAILGAAAMIALHTETVSETTLPLISSLRILEADYQRMLYDIRHSSSSHIGFTKRTDKPHIEAISAANARQVRKKDLSWLIVKFIFSPSPLCDKAKDVILNFHANLPFEYEEDRDNPDIQRELTAQAYKYVELTAPENYQIYQVKEESDQVAIVYENPSKSKPENIAKAKEASKRLEKHMLYMWAESTFEKNKIDDAYTLEAALALAKETDSADLFSPQADNNDEINLGMHRGAIAATAAIVLNFRNGLTVEDLEWSRNVLQRAMNLEEKISSSWHATSVIPWHYAIYVVRGIAADLQAGTGSKQTVAALLNFIAYPLEAVSLAALHEIGKLWHKDRKFCWAGIFLAFSLCHIPSSFKAGEVLSASKEAQEAIQVALDFYENGEEWPSIPPPPPAWIKIDPSQNPRAAQRKTNRAYSEYFGSFSGDEQDDSADEWGEPSGKWNHYFAKKVLKHVPFDDILNDDAKNIFLEFLLSIFDWTIQKNSPPWKKSGYNNRNATERFEWTNSLGRTLGFVAGAIPFDILQPRIIDPILKLEDDACWDLLAPFVEMYICRHIYDAQIIPPEAIKILSISLERLLQSSAFKPNSYRCGELSGFQQPELARSLMFVSVEHADLATRYVNGDWSEINTILPIVDRFIRAGGWAASIMAKFLTLCERAKAYYPAEIFANQILAIIEDKSIHLKGWHEAMLPARIAELVQHFSYRETPMPLDLAQKFLKILDLLVDMGDRRSAALQLSETFRDIRLSQTSE